MKLVYFQTSRMPTEKAHGAQIAKMCEAFATPCPQGGGVEVELVLPRRLNKIRQDIFAYYGVKKNFKITKLPCLDVLLFGEFLGHLLFFLTQLSFALFLVPYIIFKKADVFYTRDKFFLFLTLFKKNIVFECHTLPKKFWLYRVWLKRAKKIVVITKILKEELVKRGVAGNKILVAPDGVDLNHFKVQSEKLKVREQLGLPADRQMALYAGHLYKWKGVYTMLESAKYLPDILFIFVGGTDTDIKIFKEKAAGLGLNNVVIAGFKPPQAIPLWLSAPDVLVLPNSAKTEISAKWTSPLKMFEYMASERPIVASALPSLQEVLNQNNAVFFEPDKEKDLAGKIKALLGDAGLQNKIAKQALLDVQKYTWDCRAKNILRFI